jgi:hypothetical protein
MAQNFTFHCQQKYTIWYDTTFTVKAESKEDAIKFLKEHSEFNADELASVLPEKVNIVDGQYIDDCAEVMEPSDNGGQSTIEYMEYDGTDKVICTNVNE